MREALEATRGIQSQAAELLSMPKRTFFAKMKQYGMSRQPTLLELGSGRVFSAAD
jgi:DNA-binding NtrC family response regulator